MQLGIDLTAPHAFLVEAQGYIPPQADGSCPPGTTSTPSMTFVLAGGPHSGTSFAAPSCAFHIQLAQRGLELHKLTVVPPATCIGPVNSSAYTSVVGQACDSQVQALGLVVLKDGINCADGSEPATGTPARGFPAGSTYECTNGALRVVNIPAGGMPINLTAVNGILNPTCFPLYAAPQATATPTETGIASPIATPRATDTPTPTPTGTPGPSESPTPRPSGSAPAFCGPNGVTYVTMITGINGQLNFYGNEAEFSASTQPFNPAPGDPFNVIGQFSIDSSPFAGVPTYAQYTDALGNSQTCGPVDTDNTGTAACTLSSDSEPVGETTFVNVDFILNCTDFMTTTSFTVGAPAPPAPTPAPTVTAPAPNGICVLRTGDGPVSIRASYTPPIDSQPVIDTGNVVVGQFNVATSTPAAITSTPLPSPTDTPVPTDTPTPTNTPTPTVTPSPTNTPTPTPTLTPTPQAPPAVPTPSPTIVIPKKLSFSLDAARVDREKHVGDREGMDQVSRGQPVNLLLYYTVRSIPHSVTRVTTYEVDRGSQVVFKAEYRGKQGSKDLGSFVRYIPYLVPSGIRPDVYTFRATLRLDGHQQTRSWTFAVVGSGSVAP